MGDGGVYGDGGHPPCAISEFHFFNFPCGSVKLILSVGASCARDSVFLQSRLSDEQKDRGPRSSKNCAEPIV